MKMPWINLTYLIGEKRINKMWENNIAKKFSKVIKNLNHQIKKTINLKCNNKKETYI